MTSPVPTHPFCLSSSIFVPCVPPSLQVANPRVELTLSELQEMATRQQQQIEAQQQILVAKVTLSSFDRQASTWRSGTTLVCWWVRCCIQSHGFSGVKITFISWG